MKHRTYHVLLLLIALSLLWTISGPAVCAQGRAERIDVKFEDVDPSGFPTVTTRVTIVDPDGVPIPDLDAADFALTEDGQPVLAYMADPYINPDVKIAVVLAIDISGSMHNSIDEAREAAKTFVNGLGPNDMVAVIAFGGDKGSVILGGPFTQIDPTREIDFTTDKAQVLDLIEILDVPSTSTRTPLYDGLFKAVQMASLVTGVDYRFVIAFTDGNEKTPNLSGSIMKEDDPIDEAKDNRVPLFTIGLGKDADVNYMQRVALMTGGDYQSAPTPDMLTGIYQNVVDKVKQQYQITYDAQVPADDQEHELELIASTPKGEGSNTVSILYTCTEKPSVTLFYLDSGGTAVPLQDGQEVTGKLTVAPQISGCSPTTKMELLIDGQVVGTAEEDPFQLIYDFSSLQSTAPGQHQVTVRASDLVGNASDDVSINVSVPPEPTPTPLPTATAPIVIVDTVTPPAVTATPTVAPTPTACAVNIGRSSIPCWVLILVGLLLVLGLIGLILFLLLRKPKQICPTCGRVMDPSWSECLFCAQHDTHVGGVVTAAAEGLEDRTEPEIPIAVAVAPPPRAYEPPPPAATQAMRREPQHLGWLIVEQGDRPGKEYRLLEGDTNIGRSGTNDIALGDTTVSRQHTRVRLKDDGYHVYDLASTNPTLVNGQPITHHVLKEGDRVQVGNVVLVYKEVHTQ